MGLHANGVRLATQGPFRVFGAANAGVICRGNWDKPGGSVNLYSGEGTVISAASIADKSGVPDGYGIGDGSWAPAIKTGGASTRYQIVGTGSLTGNAAAGIAAEAALSGSGSLTALDTALALAVAALTGTGTLSGAPGASVEAQAALSGTGSMSATATAVVNALADLAGSGALAAFATALTSAQANLSGTGTLGANGSAGFLSAAALSGVGTLSPTGTAIAHAEANLTVTAAADPLSPTALAAAVWNAFVAEFQSAGSFGEAIGQGSAGLTAQQIRDAMKLAPTAGAPAAGSVDLVLAELHRILGLDPTRPLVVTASERTAGAEIEQTIVEAPAGTVTVTRQ